MTYVGYVTVHNIHVSHLRVFSKYGTPWSHAAQIREVYYTTGKDQLWVTYDDNMLSACFYWQFIDAEAINISSNIFVRGVGPVFLDDVNCRGNETNVDDCPHRGVGVHDCDHGEDAGVMCPQQGSHWTKFVFVITYQERIIKTEGGRACNYSVLWNTQNLLPVLKIECWYSYM